MGDTEFFVSQYIEKKYYDITMYHDIFCISMIGKLHIIILNKKIPNVDDLYLKLKYKDGPLVGYNFYQKFDDFYSFLCKKKL